VIEQGGEDGAVALALQRGDVRRVEQFAGLVVTQRRCLALVALDRRALHALDRIVRHGVALAQVLEEGGEGGEAVALGHAAKSTPRQIVAPGDDVGAGHGAELDGLPDAGEAHEVLQGVLVGASRRRAAEVGEPLQLGRNLGQALEGRRRQKAGVGGDKCGELAGGHGRPVYC
jgi:hypothetical protein